MSARKKSPKPEDSQPNYGPWLRTLSDADLQAEFDALPRMTAKITRERPALRELANAIVLEMARRFE